MGEVYRATDTKLNRDVALKVLPEEFARDADRMARFKREAQVLASLNHPNIAAIYGLEESEGTRCLVLELVEGPTLAERIKQGAIPLDEALNIAKQIAEALEAAHEKGIIHRDLKPANVKVTPEGMVKVLDFGLAKALEDDPSSIDISKSPTLSVAATQAGVILGTAAYMSPEQARGQPVDKRADIWSFGVVLYEMLTGKQAFKGDTISDTLAAVLRAEVDWDVLPAGTPASIRRLLRRCLTRDRKQRLQAIGDARFEIEEALTGSTDMDATAAVDTTPSQPVWQRILPWALAGVMAVAVAGLSWQLSRSPSTTGENVRFVVNLPPDLSLNTSGRVNIAISPDGTKIVFSAIGESGFQLFLKKMHSLELEPLAGTAGGDSPFFSPDGKWLGFVSGGKLRKVSVEGGSPIILADTGFGGAAWNTDGTIIYTPSYTSGLWRVPDSGGTPEKLTTPDSDKGVLGHWWPQLLPGGQAVVFTRYSSPIKSARVAILDLRTGQMSDLIEGAVFGRYVPTGHLVYVRANTLMAVPIDPGSLKVTGAAFPVLDDISLDLANAASQLSFSAEGTLAYVPKSVVEFDRMLVWVDRKGNETPVTGRRGRYFAPELSPDGSRIALNRTTEDGTNIWLYEIRRGVFTRLTFGDSPEYSPLWTPDGKNVIHIEEKRQWDLSIIEAGGTGSEQLLVSTEFDKYPEAVTPDGKFLIFREGSANTLADLWLIPLDALTPTENKPTVLLQTQFSERGAKLSPNGRWLAYASDETGQFEVYVIAFPDPGGKTKISTDGGNDPRWSRDGRRLFYRNGRKMMEVAIDYTKGFSPKTPVTLFEGSYEATQFHPGYSVATDGRFLMVKNPPESLPRQIHVILNWFEELRRRVPTK